MIAINKLTQINSSLVRKHFPIQQRKQNQIVINNNDYINFCNNDYLGLASCRIVKKTFANAVNKYGFGSSSSALISGYFKIQQELEEKFAKFLRRDRAILFNSGYLANIGTITALTDRHSSIIADKLCHASILDGIQLSKTKHYRFQHNNISHLKYLLELPNVNNSNNKILITESIFSMEGDFALIKEIVEQAKLNNATTIVDDAHGIGFLGKSGRGISEVFNFTQTDIHCLVTPLGKAFGGLGAIVSGSNHLIETILQFARSYRYTTALPPAICATFLKVLDLIEHENWRREKLNLIIKYFIKQAVTRKLPLISYDKTPIKCILIPNNTTVQKIQQEMLQAGFLVSSIRPPTVPPDTARIRISLNLNHTKTQIEKLLDRLKALYVKYT